MPICDPIVKIQSHSRLLKLRTFARFLLGLSYLAPSVVRAALDKKNKIISIDVFGTLIERIFDEHNALRASALKTAETARIYGLIPPDDPVAYRRRIEKEIFEELAQSGKSSEFTNETIISRMLRQLGAGEWAAEAASEIAVWELEQEMACTRPQPRIINWLNDLKLKGHKIIAVSDTRYTATELSRLFARHSITNISTIYSSVDHGVSKFGGKLFDVVLEKENLKPRDILHTGDNLLSDILSAAQRGLAVRWVRRPSTPPALPMAVEIDPENAAFDLGYKTLGPVLVGFIRLVLDQARRDGIKQLSFVARDGCLPLLIAEIFAKASSETLPPAMTYIHLSRRVAASASTNFLKMAHDPISLNRLVSDISSLRGDNNFITRLQNYFSLPASIVQREFERLGLSVGDELDLRKILCDETAANSFNDAVHENGNLLFDYLMQEKILSADTALVDIGWRGSIHQMVEQIGAARNFPAPAAYYMGFWGNELFHLDQRNSHGLICDQRRS